MNSINTRTGRDVVTIPISLTTCSVLDEKLDVKNAFPLKPASFDDRRFTKKLNTLIQTSVIVQGLHCTLYQGTLNDITLDQYTVEIVLDNTLTL